MNDKLFHSPVYLVLKLISQWEPDHLKQLVKRNCVNLSQLLSVRRILQYPLPLSCGPQQRLPRSSRCFFFWVSQRERNAFDANANEVLTEDLPPVAGTLGTTV